MEISLSLQTPQAFLAEATTIPGQQMTQQFQTLHP